MKKFILIKLTIILSLSAFSQTVQWAKSEPYSSWVQWTSIVIHDNFGNSFIRGEYNSYAGDLSTGRYIIKYDANGNKLWEKSGYGGALSMCTDTSGNLYTAGYELFEKYDPNGNLLWSKYTPYALWIAEKTDAQNNLVANGYVAGETEDTVHLENNITLISTPNGSTQFIARYNTNGECLWAIPDEGGINPFVCNQNGDMVITGGVHPTTIGKGAKQITFYPSNGYTYIAKYASNGELEWAKQVLTIIAPDETGNLYSFEIDVSDIPHDSNKNRYLVKYDVTGNEIWKRTHLYLPDGYKFAMKCGANGDLYITGGFRASMTIDDTTINASGNYHVFVAKIDSSGTFKWITTTGGSGGAGAKDITIANGNEIYITGDMSGTNTFGTSSINQTNGVFVAKIIDNDVSTSIKDFPKTNTVFNVYPNPSTNIVNVVYNSNHTIENFKLEIKNSIGQVIYSTSAMSINNGFKKSIDLSKQTKGIYFIEIIADKKREVRKIILN